MKVFNLNSERGTNAANLKKRRKNAFDFTKVLKSENILEHVEDIHFSGTSCFVLLKENLSDRVDVDERLFELSKSNSSEATQKMKDYIKKHMEVK